MKSPILKAITKPVRAISERLNGEYKKAVAKHLDQKKGRQLTEDEKEARNEARFIKSEERKVKSEAAREQRRTAKLKARLAPNESVDQNPRDPGPPVETLPMVEVEKAPETLPSGNLEGFDPNDVVDPEDPPPIEARFGIMNTTIQKLYQIMQENPRGVFCIFDELTSWFNNMVRYGKNGGNDLSYLLPLDTGQSVSDDTISRGTTYVRAAFAPILGGIPPGVLKEALTSEFVQSGGSARFCFVMPPRTKTQMETPPFPEAIRKNWEADIKALFSLCMAGDDKNPVPFDIELVHGSTAWEQWKLWWGPHIERIHQATGAWASFLSKMEGKALRIALVLCVSDRVFRGHGHDTSPIEAIWIEAGCIIADWFIYERARVEALLGSDEPGKVTLADQ